MIRALLAAASGSDRVNFLLTNRIPRRLATRLVGRLSRIEHPLVVRASLSVWQLFTRLDLSDAAETSFASLHACFTRRLRPGARRFDPDPAVLASPCDGIVGEAGPIADGMLMQVKGMPYALADLLCDEARASIHRDGCYVTLRLTSAMYHRFHAPADLQVHRVTHVAGDRWNVNPPALARVARLYCRNERAIVEASLADGSLPVTLVPVAAILVAGIRFGFLDLPSTRPACGIARYRTGARLLRGDEMGWFEHGSTIVLLAPAGASVLPGLGRGTVVRAGQGLVRVARAG